MGVQLNDLACQSPRDDMTGEVLPKSPRPGPGAPSRSSTTACEDPPSSVSGKPAAQQPSAGAAGGCSVERGAALVATQQHQAGCSTAHLLGGTIDGRGDEQCNPAATAALPHGRRSAPKSEAGTDNRENAAAERTASPLHRQPTSTERSLPAPPIYTETASNQTAVLPPDCLAGCCAAECHCCRSDVAAAAAADDGLLTPSPHQQPGSVQQLSASDHPRLLRTKSAALRIDAAAARRLARRLYNLDGFKRSDVVRHLSKNNNFVRLVADEYLLHFDFSGLTLVEAMRAFFGLHPLPIGSAESPEQQCVAAHVARRYASCNPGFLQGAASSLEDSCRTLACAILLLNANLHGSSAGKKIPLCEFVRDVQSLHGGYAYPESLLQSIYADMQIEALGHIEDSESDASGLSRQPDPYLSQMSLDAMDSAFEHMASSTHAARTQRTLMQMISLSTSFEYKRGYVRRKCCKGINGVKLAFGKRSWKTYFAVLRGTTLRLADSEPAYDRDAVRLQVNVDNALASVAFDYKKSPFVLRLETADGGECLLQTGDSLELEDWVEVINLVAASMSCTNEPPPLRDESRSATLLKRMPAANRSAGSRNICGEVLDSLAGAAPSSPAAGTDGSVILDLKSRMKEHDWRAAEIEHELTERRRHNSEQSNLSSDNGVPIEPVVAAAKQQSLTGRPAPIINEHLLQLELKRRRVYSELLKKKLAEFPELDTTFAIPVIGECDDEPPVSPRPSYSAPTCVSPWGSL